MAVSPRLSCEVEGVRVPVELGALFPPPLEKGLRPDRLRHSWGGTARGEEGGGVQGRSSPRLMGGLGIKALEAQWRHRHYQKSPGLGYLTSRCCAGDAPVSTY